MPYLALRSNTFFVRISVPRVLRAALGQSEIFQSLNTSNRDEAKILAMGLMAELLIKFTAWKTDLKKSPLDELENIGRVRRNPDGSLGLVADSEPETPSIDLSEIRKFEIDVLPNGQPFIKKTDPSKPNDFRDAQKALRLAQQASKTPPPQPKSELAGVMEKIHGIKPRNIHGAVSDFLDDLKSRNKTSMSQYKSGIGYFVDWITKQHPNISVHKISKEHMQEYRKVLEQTKIERKGGDFFSPNNVYKHMGYLETFFRFCQIKEWMISGDIKLPTFGLKGKKPDYDDSEDSYQAFTQTELQRLVAVENYQPLHKRPDLYWAPLLGLFTGGRRAEIANLDPEDISQVDGVHLINFNKMVKTKNSRRRVPLHRKLIELGFLNYIEDVRNFFPTTKAIFPYTWKIDKIMGEGFAEHCDRCKVVSPKKVFHSFRKNVAQTLVMAGVVEENYREHFIGHLKYSLHTRVYSGKALPMKFYSGLLNKHLKYDLDLSHLKYRRGMFDDFLREQKKAQDRNKRFGK